ncbi:squalene/phytoene synthase family protein [uncultured Pedobacter sp.]|uniref:phytoene/squalene synthase family protein n=1 Tax=uncultured Pedobacter sp. TaxID=246139 RepID=UPI0025DF19C1|nr:squalene/phytoene synthase family protein [uncultured Pedobacter sp.]
MINKVLFDHVSAVCSRKITLAYSTSFSLGISFLGRKLQQPIYDIYGFVRLADEIVDSFVEYNGSVLLNELKEECFAAINRGISLNPVINSFQRTVNEYQIDHNLIHSFLHSMEMDLYPVNFDFNQYDKYILGSAEVVGLMCLKVFVEGDRQAYEKLKPFAMKLGAAFQKVNFLRDLNADYIQLKRSYFPEIDPNLLKKEDKQRIEHEISADFKEALIGITLLPESSRKGVYLAYIYYKELLKKIKKMQPDQLLAKRSSISNLRKLLLLGYASVRHALNLL